MKVDRMALHRYLWENSSRHGQIEIHQGHLAEKLGVTQATCSISIGDLRKDGRIKKIGSRASNVGVYTIRDPANFLHHFVRGQESVVDGLFRCEVCGEFELIGEHTPRRI